MILSPTLATIYQKRLHLKTHAEDPRYRNSIPKSRYCNITLLSDPVALSPVKVEPGTSIKPWSMHSRFYLFPPRYNHNASRPDCPLPGTRSGAPVAAFAVKGTVASWEATITGAFPVASALCAWGETKRNNARK